MLERLKIWYRTHSYKTRKDPGGIKYIEDSVQKGDVVFDIGAHKGGYLNKIRQIVGKKGLVVGFEPQKVLYNYLKGLTESLKWSNVIVEPYGISDKPGSATLYIPVNAIKQDSSPGATILDKNPEAEINRVETIELESLDNYISRTSIKPVLLKIDVEGNELNVFKGGVNYLKSHKPKILVEIEARHIGEDRVNEVIEWLRDLGYKGQFIHGEEVRALDEFTFDTFQDVNDMANYCNNFIFE